VVPTSTFVDGGVSDHDVPGVMELRSEWRYVLAPGSFVDPGETDGNGLYEIEHGERPVMLFPEDLPDELCDSRGDYEEELPVVGGPDEPIKNAHGWTLEKIRGEDEKVDKLLDELNPGSYPSKSEADFAVSVKLLYWEFSPGQVKDVLRGFRTRSKVLDRPDYVNCTVESAQSQVDETISDIVDTETWRPGSVYDEILTGGNSDG